MAQTRKALNYDLDDLLLQQYYPNPKSYKYAWTKVKKFLYKNGFEDRQYSGVVSSKPMSNLTAQRIAKDLNDTFEWLAPCIQEFDVTSVLDTYSLKSTFIVKKGLKRNKK